MNRQLLPMLLLLELALKAKAEEAEDDKAASAEPTREEDLYRNTGRSTSLALKQAQAAMDAATHKESYIVFDHHDTAKAHRNQAIKVSELLKVLRVDHIISNNVITVLPLLTADEREFGPLPSWAVRHNKSKELVPGAQLCTRDGRKTGNAHLMSLDPTTGIWCILTDAGSHLRCTANEVNELFFVGDFVSDPEEVEARFGRN